MRFLINPIGSYGDVYPFIAIGRQLAERGHDVHLVASGYFGDAIERAGLACTPIGDPEDYERMVGDADLSNPRRALKLIATAISETLPRTYQILDQRTTDDTVLVGSTLSFATRIVNEVRGNPWIPVHLAPSIFRSNIAPPRFLEQGLPPWLPGAFADAMWWIGDRIVIDPLWATGVNEFRSSLGLEPISRIFRDWIHSPDLTIGLFPDWFGPRQTDWPNGVQLTGFPLYDQPEPGLPPEVEAFLDAGDPPVVFVSGTATASEARFYAESVWGCTRAGVRGLLLTRFPQQLPDDLPDGVTHFPSIPFSQLLPRCRAIVHHGGVGTLSQALRAGIPQIVRPYGFDQFDNADRLVRLGVGREIPNGKYRAVRVARVLETLSEDPTLQQTCRDVADRFTEDAVSTTCSLLESRADGI
ncbi:TPA: hypothetical protein DCE37_06860 [Candidatus Latescibacteria bacterium]|nr:hypothetical protein [Candidatus Latescibacterota bacterium]